MNFEFMGGSMGRAVGSAIVKRIFQADPGSEVEQAGNFCRELRKAAG